MRNLGTTPSSTADSTGESEAEPPPPSPNVIAALEAAAVGIGALVLAPEASEVAAVEQPVLLQGVEGLAARGPAATLNLAMQVQGSTPLSAQTVALMETTEGPTLVGAGEADLTAEQVVLARQLGLTPTAMPGFHAEQTVINGAGERGLTPTSGVATNNVCAGRCGVLIRDIGGWFNGKNFGF